MHRGSIAPPVRIMVEFIVSQPRPCFFHVPCCDKRRNLWTAVSQALMQQPNSPEWQHALECVRQSRRNASLGSCAVVGSSGGLAGGGLGRLIEEHDVIFRINNGAEHTGGAYANDAGNRTSVWVSADPLKAVRGRRSKDTYSQTRHKRTISRRAILAPKNHSESLKPIP